MPRSYRKPALQLGLLFVFMYLVMYHLNLNNLYMTRTMVATMPVLMLWFMREM